MTRQAFIMSASVEEEEERTANESPPNYSRGVSRQMGILNIAVLAMRSKRYSSRGTMVGFGLSVLKKTRNKTKD